MSYKQEKIRTSLCEAQTLFIGTLTKIREFGPKRLDVALNIGEVEEISLENLRLRSTWSPFNSISECRKGALFSDGGTFCLLWLDCSQISLK